MGFFDTLKNGSCSERRYTGFSNVPKDELCHYQDDKEYYTYETTIGIAIPYEEHVKSAQKADSGFYLPVIAKLYYCEKTKKHPAKDEQQSPAYWRFKYGIVGVHDYLKKLANSYLELKRKAS